MNFNIRQKKVIESTESKILCLACAASGKTATLTERVRYIINNGCSSEKIACITFTTMAAEEMRKRLGSVAKGAYIGTIHGLANNICIANGINTDKYIADMKFDKLIEKAMTIPRGKYPHFEHLLVDEFQDICNIEYKFIEKIPSKNFFFCGDERQAIYSFKGATDKFLRDLYDDVNCKKYFLTENYRNAPNIIKFADDLIGSMQKLSPQSKSVKKQMGYINDEITFNDAIEQLEWSGDWGNWFILCRTNDELVTAINILNQKKIPCISFKKGDLDLIEMESLLKDNRVKVLTIHTAKGLENKHVIVTGAKMFNEEERKIAYVAATRAEQSLYWTPSICKRKRNVRHKDRDKADAGRVFEKASMGMVSFE